jgi:hypothetical protein
LLANRTIQLMQLAWMTGDGANVAPALESLREAIEIAPAGSPIAGQLQGLLAAGLMTRGMSQPAAQRDETLRAAWAAVTRATEVDQPWPQALVIQMAMAQALGADDPGVRAEGENAARRLRAAREELAERGLPTEMIDMAALMVEGFAAIGPAGNSELLEAAILRMDAMPAGPAPPMARHLLGMQQARLLRHRDNMNWKQSLQTYLAAQDRPDLPRDRMRQWLAQGRPDTSGLGDYLGQGLSERIRDSPDRRRSRQIGLQVLRGHLERVLLQSGTDDAIATARAAVGDSHEVVTWCAADGADDDAIAALETGRGLALLAAAVAGSVSSRLEAMDEPGLARAWQQSRADAEAAGPGDDGPAVPDDVRHRILDRLTASGELPGLLKPPTREDLADTLKRLGYDALVYLIPQGRSQAMPASAGQPPAGFAGRSGGALMVTATCQTWRLARIRRSAATFAPTLSC